MCISTDFLLFIYLIVLRRFQKFDWAWIKISKIWNNRFPERELSFAKHLQQIYIRIGNQEVAGRDTPTQHHSVGVNDQ